MSSQATNTNVDCESNSSGESEFEKNLIVNLIAKSKCGEDSEIQSMNRCLGKLINTRNVQCL